VLTVDFGRFPVRRENRVLDLGCGDGRHAFEAYKRGADVVAVDLDDTALKHVHDMFLGIAEAGEAPGYARALALRGDAFALPFPDGGFDRVIAAEVFEHLEDDRAALAEAVRVLAPGGLLAITVPRWWPERVCWALSAEYHEVEGGHVRIYRRRELLDRVREAGLEPIGTHHAHALHAPFWWLKCAGLSDENPIVRRYHAVLCWEMMHGRSPVRLAEQALNPLLGKSFVLYARKP
jgi:SAM-dependent methyltransferase